MNNTAELFDWKGMTCVKLSAGGYEAWIANEIGSNVIRLRDNVNGLEFIEKLRADSRFSRLPVFALTADSEYRHDARSALFTGALLKPLTYDRLMTVFSSTDLA